MPSDTISITPIMVTRSGLRQEIQDLRKRKGWTQQQLADRIGVSRIYISKLEQGDRLSPSLDVLERLAQAFGVRLTIELGVSTPGRRAKPSSKTKGGKR